MSWMQKLYETYNNCEAMIGKGADDKEVSLLPICHTTQKAQIEIVLDQDGNFQKARVISKNEARTIIPSTERAAGRTHINAHALSDKLQYVAKDYQKYDGKKKPGYERNPDEKNKDETYYYEQLNEWCASLANPKAIAVLNYVKKGTLIRDLIEHNILIANNSGKLLDRWDKVQKKEIPEIFKVINEQAESFVRWVVEIPGNPCSKTWEDPALWQSWIMFYTGTKKIKSVCYVTGRERFMADQHPKKIRNDGDGAKLISSNDSSGFTFRGRFINADQACGVGFEATQKAHSALRWLIGRQGYKGKDGQTIVAWATNGVEIPKPTDDPLAILGFDELPSDQSNTVSTAQDLALKLKKKIMGYGKEIGDTTNIVVMGLDAATPGRMAITFYKELRGSDFLQRINDWHTTCAWVHRYGYNSETKRHYTFVGAPAPFDIAESVFGKKADDKIKKATVARIFPCIIDKQPIPRDIVETAVRRVSQRLALDDWEWNKTLSIACALFKKSNTKENYNMALEETRKSRDYLYGRLLAIADRLEGSALYKAKEKRDTNAARYMQLFAEHPHKTWRQIELSLIPYKARLGGAHYFTGLIDEVMCKFNLEDFINDKPLTGEFLLGYHCQRSRLWEKLQDEEPEVTQAAEKSE